jgi:transcriptional regulator with XRE-family HTH domain
MALKILPYIVRARMTLGWNQRQLGENLGMSHRTATRWESGRSEFDTIRVTRLATLVYPLDRDLAEGLVGCIGQTLVGLGIEAPPPPPAPTAPLAPPPATDASRALALRDVLDCIVYAVADASDMTPKAVRPLALIALRRAHELGFDVAAAAKAKLLEPPAPEAPQYMAQTPS